MTESQAQTASLSQDRARNAFLTQIETFRSALPALDELSSSITASTGASLLDWIDALHLVDEPRRRSEWHALGWRVAETHMGHDVLRYPDGSLPPIVLHGALVARLDLRVDHIESFLSAHGLAGTARVDGAPGCSLRRAGWRSLGLRAFGVVQRRGELGFAPEQATALDPGTLARWIETLRMRTRVFEDESDGIERTAQLLQQASTELGQAVAVDLFLRSEREYWQWRNHSARLQYRRQQGLGLGWSNHGAHEYRASEEHYDATLALFRDLGFQEVEGPQQGERRELAHPSGQRVVCEVHASPRDDTDLEHLWTALHGESLLQAGLHSLQAVEFRGRAGEPGLQDDLWSVDPGRVRRLVRSGRLGNVRASQLLDTGARGSLLLARGA